MLRTIILLLTHLGIFSAGAAIVAIPLRARRQELAGKAAALDTHEMFLNGRADQLRRGAFPVEFPAAGRHRATPGRSRTQSDKAGRLIRAGLDEAVAIIATAEAKRRQEHRAFADIMTNVAQAKRWCQATASVVAESMLVGEIPGWAHGSFEPSTYYTVMGAR